MLVYGKYECFVMHMLYVCVLCASCGNSQCCILHDLQFVNAGRGCKRRPYGRGRLQSLSHDCLIGSHECLLLFTTSCCFKRHSLQAVELSQRSQTAVQIVSNFPAPSYGGPNLLPFLLLHHRRVIKPLSSIILHTVPLFR